MPVLTGSGTLVLLTRPKGSSDAFLTALRGLRADIVEAPVQEIVPVGEMVDLAPDAAAIFTSRHAVRRVRNGAGRLAFCVGDATADAAREAGFTAVSASGDAQDLRALLIRERPPGDLVYLRGRHVSHDLAADLKREGFKVESFIVYDQQEVALDPETLAAVRRATRLVFPLFSPRSARILARQLPDGLAPVIVAISDRTAEAWERPAAECLIADAPTAEVVLDLTRRVLDSDSPS